MRPWHLLPALVACAVASCYLPGGIEADEEWVPCNKVDGFAFCCQDGDTCLDNGLCSSKSGVRIHAGACQNADWSACRHEHEILDTIAVELKPRQATVTVGDVGPASTVVVIATATQTQPAVIVSADPTSEPTVSATSESTHSSSSSKKNLIPIIAGAAGGAVLLAGLAGLAFFCYRRKQKKRRLDAEIRASIQSDWLGQVTVGSGKRPSEVMPYHDLQPKSPSPGDVGVGGNKPVELGDTGRSSVPVEMGNRVKVVEIDDGRRVDLPAEMDAERSPPMSSSTQQPPWVVPRGVYEIG